MWLLALMLKLYTSMDSILSYVVIFIKVKTVQSCNVHKNYNHCGRCEDV